MDEGGAHGARPLILSTGGVLAHNLSAAHEAPLSPAGLKMQLTNAPDAAVFPAMEAAMQRERIARYGVAAGGDNAAAFRIYLWNCDRCEAFHLPLHFAEVVCRNAVHRCLLARIGQGWQDHKTFRQVLDGKFLRELDAGIADEMARHREKMTEHHVVSALTFGFWEHLTTKRFERLLWSRGIGHSFPGAGGMGRQDLHDLIEKVRRWRNRIAHHEPIFDKGPAKKHQEVLDLIKAVCPDTASWVTSASRVQAVINLRPA